ncbi:12407_t:CDS:2 [Ambispora leptoticha]|uniref:Mitochondrial import inner membrane translocase subunit TIM50 n=1 Tax=Ambispora leptoticha TaxID=144679 RepID=A0A9N9ATY0_9GLOM|nr:12407_t:CDS:2 [Ambispora leptoticha]
MSSQVQMQRLAESIKFISPRRGISTFSEVISSKRYLYDANKQEPPSLFYLENAINQTSITLKRSDPKLIILDLNGTLVYRDKSHSNRTFPRPFLMQFLDYIFERFYVMIWSSASPHNVKKIIDAVFPPRHSNNLVDVWARDTFGLTTFQYNQKWLTIKNLEIVWDRLNSQNNRGRESPPIWSQKNTVLIDDSPLKAQLQPYNAIHIDEYDVELHRSRRDKELKDVITYLSNLRYESNVSAFMRKNPYKHIFKNKESYTQYLSVIEQNESYSRQYWLEKQRIMDRNKKTDNNSSSLSVNTTKFQQPRSKRPNNQHITTSTSIYKKSRRERDGGYDSKRLYRYEN